MAKSRPLKDSGVVSITFSLFPHAKISLPADLEEASSLASATGKFLFSRR